jgi:uncharacterized coiled-coil protein SlyX
MEYLRSRATPRGGDNVAIGYQALFSNTTGGDNVAIGHQVLFSNTTGSGNNALGETALGSNTVGVDNNAIGFDALSLNTTGFDNTAIGDQALRFNVIGNDNTAIGRDALSGNIVDGNTAVGGGALMTNTTGVENTAIGEKALTRNTTGRNGTAIGWNALFSNTASDNTAVGAEALGFNTTGAGNTAMGNLALESNTIDNQNTPIGYGTLSGNTTGSNNIALGFNAGGNLTSGDNDIYLGSLGVATESNTIRIGTSGTQNRAFIRGIRGVTTGNNNAIPVLIDTAGQLGTTSSSRRFKKEIKPMDSASEAILALKPVTFHYRSDKTNTPQFGLIAEEVAEVNPDLVVGDENGEIYTVRYDAVNAMLLNEFLKEHKTVEELNAAVAKQDAAIAQQRKDFNSIVTQQQNRLQSKLAEQEKQIAALASGLQKVEAQVEMSKPVTKVVSDRP